MSEVKGLNDTVEKLRALAAKAMVDNNVAVAVGYTANYALAIHENMELYPPGMRLKGKSRDPRIRRIEEGGDPAKARPRARKRNPKGRFWDPQDRAGPKFLEGPARELRLELGNIVAQALAKGQTMAQALLQAGLRLQRESQLRVPVDTGNLKNSAFTRLEQE